MWKIYASSSLSLLLAAGLTWAQGGLPTGPSPAGSQGAQAGFSAPAGGVFESNTFLEMSNRIFDPTSDSMDFENGSFDWKGKKFNITEQRAFRARFERFLLASPSQEEEQYAALMEDILNRLSVSNNNDDDAILDTWQLLFRATDFAIDGGNSTIVANQVFNAWRVRKESRGVALSQKELADIRKYQQDVVANRTRMADQLRLQRMRDAGKKGSEDAAAADSGALAPLSEASFRVLDLAETEARILALEAEAASTGIQAKLQFQSQIVSFLMQRRFEHALVLSGFYQWLFKGSHQRLEVGRSQLEQLLPGSDLNYTVDSMSFLAREAINDVESGVDAVNAAYREGRTILALERLQEVFFLGEYLTQLNRIPTGQRRHLLDLYRGLMEASDLAESKDYSGLAELVEKIAGLAEDFPKTRALAGIETAKSMSDMAVFAASQYRNLGQIEQAREELRQAIDIWPSNPAIREFQMETTKLATAGSQGLKIFDDLYQRNERRAIYERRMELGFALSDDNERRPLLMEVVDQVARIELLVKQSQELVKQGEAYAAWELLIEAARIDRSDGPLNQARAELAPRVSDFVRQLDQADSLAESGQHAAALAAYLAAQDVYPASKTCRVGIAREAADLMRGLQPVEAGMPDN